MKLQTGLGENFNWKGIPEEDNQEELTEDSPRVSTMRKWLAELVIQNPDFTIDDIEDMMRKSNINDKLILFVLGIEKLNSLKVSTTTQLIEYMQGQNPNLTRDDITSRMGIKNLD